MKEVLRSSSRTVLMVVGEFYPLFEFFLSFASSSLIIFSFPISHFRFQVTSFTFKFNPTALTILCLSMNSMLLNTFKVLNKSHCINKSGLPL